MAARWLPQSLGIASDRWAMACLGLVLFQVVQAAFVGGSADFLDSYWLGTYDEGFTRRGLGGELTQLLTGGELSRPVASLKPWAITALLSGLLVFIVIDLLRRPYPSARWLAVVLCAAPFGFDFLLTQRRPDQLSFAVFVVFALYLARTGHRRPTVASLIAGVSVAVTMLIHEGGGLIALPWMIVAVVVSRSGEPGVDVHPARRSAPIVALVVPVVVVGSILVATGAVSPEEEASLRAAAVEKAGLVDIGALGFFDQSLSDSLRFVRAFLPWILPGTVLVVAVVALLVLFVLRPTWAGCDLGRRERWFVAVVLGASFGFLFATGIDWLRWACWFGLGAAVVLAVLMPLRRATDDEREPAGSGEPARPRPDELPYGWVALVVAATYLAALPPLPAVVTVWEAADLLLMLGRREGL